MPELLRIDSLHVTYGEASALRDVNIEVNQSQIVAIIGANGAGKTTLVNTIAGILQPRSGHIWLNDKDLSLVEPHHVCDYGIAIVPEGRRLFTKLTVMDNLNIGAYRQTANRQRSQSLDYVLSIFPRLAERRTQIAGTLSGGEQQMLAIGRALMARPSLLLLDEPSLGLAPIIVENIFNVIEQTNQDEATTILLVEQNATKALDIADYTYVLSDGQIVQEGPSETLSEDDRIQRAYLGLSH
jgi:branched-chain amino acid transport system ATP-binding protein